MSEQFRPFGRKVESNEEAYPKKKVPLWGTFGQPNPPTMPAPNFGEELYDGQKEVLSTKEIDDIEEKNHAVWRDETLSELLGKLRAQEALLYGDSGPGTRDLANDIDLLQRQIKRRVSLLAQ